MGGGPRPWQGERYVATCIDSEGKVATLSGDGMTIVWSGESAEYFVKGVEYVIEAAPAGAGHSGSADSQSPQAT